MAIEQWHVDSPKTIDLELVRHVRVNMMGGSINIISHDLPSTRVEVSSLTGRDMKIAIDGDTLIVDHPQFGWGSLGESARTLVDPPKATVSILVPKNVSVNVKSTSADVLVTGVDGEIAITTIGGEHFMDSTAGKLHLTSAGGELSVRGHRGTIEARTATGDVTVTGAISSFDGNTISGSTVIDVSGQDAPPTFISHASVSGAVTVRLPATTNASYQFATVAAKAQIGDLILDPQYGKMARYEAPLPGEPITEVKLNTVAGRITVLGGLPVSKDAGAGVTNPGATNPGTSNTGTTVSGESQAAAWVVPPNPNVNLADAPRPEGNIVPPIPGAADVPTPSTPPAGTQTADAPAADNQSAGTGATPESEEQR